MTPDPKQMLRDFIAKEIIRRPDMEITNDTALLTSGLVDSFALVEILHQLEDITHMRIPAGKVRPSDFESVDRMFEMADRVGKPR